MSLDDPSAALRAAVRCMSRVVGAGKAATMARRVLAELDGLGGGESRLRWQQRQGLLGPVREMVEHSR